VNGAGIPGAAVAAALVAGVAGGGAGASLHALIAQTLARSVNAAVLVNIASGYPTLR
jgi:hypothetical protein